MLKKILNLFKGWHEKKIVLLLLGTGSTLVLGGIAKEWWLPILIPLINNQFNQDIPLPDDSIDYVVFAIGLVLIGLGIWFYFKTKEKRKLQTMLQIRHSSIEAGDYSKVDVDLSNYNIEPFSIIQTEELKNINEQNLQHALREQDKIVQKILQHLDGHTDIEVSYWGLAHIPLLVLLGYQIADKSNSSYFEWNQNFLKWEKVKEKSEVCPPLMLEEDISKQTVDETKEVIVRIGVTYPIHETDLNGLDLDKFNSFYLHLKPPHRNAIKCMEQLNEYQKQFRQLLDKINQTYPHLEKIHLFYSGQPSLAYRLGSTISPRMDKEIWVYNHLGIASPKYNWAINLQKAGNPVKIKITGANQIGNEES